MSIPFQRDVTITRTDPGSRVRGEWVNGATSTLTIKATVLPPTGRGELALIVQNTLGGTNLNGELNIYTESLIIAADEENGIVGDKFTFDNKKYEIAKVNHHINVIPHYKGVCILTDDKENS